MPHCFDGHGYISCDKAWWLSCENVSWVSLTSTHTHCVAHCVFNEQLCFDMSDNGNVEIQFGL